MAVTTTSSACLYPWPSLPSTEVSEAQLVVSAAVDPSRGRVDRTPGPRLLPRTVTDVEPVMAQLCGCIDDSAGCANVTALVSVTTDRDARVTVRGNRETFALPDFSNMEESDTHLVAGASTAADLARTVLPCAAKLLPRTVTLQPPVRGRFETICALASGSWNVTLAVMLPTPCATVAAKRKGEPVRVYLGTRSVREDMLVHRVCTDGVPPTRV
mmetsp:Transcript_27558/g.63464  ORF Transcript_27558/g.63464 Transcript_27558/m.63464 type:complete len:214 (-) Transcript_27558:251-892(-)